MYNFLPLRYKIHYGTYTIYLNISGSYSTKYLHICNVYNHQDNLVTIDHHSVEESTKV